MGPVGSSLAQGSEPRAPASPAKIIAYHDSGEWDHDITEVTDRAVDAMTRRLDGGNFERPAVVLDIDDTALSSYDCLKRVNFVRTRGACADSATLPAIEQTLELYRYARSRQVNVFFVTGRRQRLRASTMANLRNVGYAGPLRVTFRPNREPRGTHDGYKARTRRTIIQRGYRILINVGDQRSDLTGGYSLDRFKVPNPMYVIKSA